MPIFVRRKLQMMLDELAPHIHADKLKDLLKRIEHRDPDQCLPAEYELALAWAVSKLGHLEVERQFGRGAPDIYSTDLFARAPAAIEITALSDDALGGETVMRRAANIINAKAAKFAKNAAQHLQYDFLEESGPLPADRSSWPFSRYFRRRRISRKFQASEELERALATWLRNVPPTIPLHWEDEDIAVVITWKDYVHPLGNTFSSMPPVCYDVRNNPLYRVLKDKLSQQLRDVPSGTLRGIFVCDAGCSLLRNLGRPAGGIREVRGEQIIRTFVERHELDFVIAFVPRYESEYAIWRHDNRRVWHTFGFTCTMANEEFRCIETLASRLPAPYLHGYQARSWHQQQMFRPQERGHYLPAHYTLAKGKSRMKISARGLQEYLAGRISLEELKRWSMGERNFFEGALAAGKTISNVVFESSGTESDDDFVVFEFEEDPAASALKTPEAN